LYFNGANNNAYVRFEVLMAVNMKSDTFWYVMLHSVVKVHLRFEGKYCFLLQGQGVSTVSKQQRVPSACLHGLIFDPEDGGKRQSYENFYWIKRCHMPQDGTLNDDCVYSIFIKINISFFKS
jgi:hypothetical protein